MEHYKSKGKHNHNHTQINQKQINEQLYYNNQQFYDDQQPLQHESPGEIKTRSRKNSLLQDKIISDLIKTLQQNEIYTLKQLYRNNFLIIKNTDRCYRLCLSFDLPADRIGLSSFTTKLLENENFEDYCTVSKLPPIFLTFKYNDDYPLLSSLEFFKLECDWLSENCLCTLSNQLITLWNTNINLPIISIWANWLKEESLFFLNLYSIRTTTTIITKQFENDHQNDDNDNDGDNNENNENEDNQGNQVNEDNQDNNGVVEVNDKNNNNNNNNNNEGFKQQQQQQQQKQQLQNQRQQIKSSSSSSLSKSGKIIQQLPLYYEESIISTHYSLTLPPMYINDVQGQDPISYLVSWDIENEVSPHIYNIKVCTLCSSDHYNVDFINIFNCNHNFCQECLSAYVTLNIENDTLESIICPDQDCQVLISPFEIKDLVSTDTYKLYLERLSNNLCEHCDQVLQLLKETDNEININNNNNNNNSHNHHHLK
ncbi:hypothetical protein DDB_G0275171 [Dictyostelium discoideum AX4]|uniref:RBR-type E3 ubiquitin transferase n=1 Tax=Dictyostelium discoideum TaxID=44689 RepID=Q86I15_DICDI|nr:hypothetical protein DDB_G0275171 [Dictyostelium discoideum AX4]EAL69866.1 hypothetical protein DDB_G0275171 [Dictyostelium discoideum AX4]|eukprot:XP_643771.1 hypothetical protein DDB_G0275171 [Dictyostelium discoideum AX4]